MRRFLNLTVFALALAATLAGAAPTITTFYPQYGSPGDSVTIYGTGFYPGTVTVKFFNNVVAPAETVSVTSDTMIQAIVPNGAATGPITVIVDGSPVSSVTNYNIVSKAPYITHFLPGYGAVGDTVILYGVHFDTATMVRFNSVPTTEISPNADGTQMSVYIPAGATSGLISAANPFGSGTNSTPFAVVGAGPYIAGFFPWSGNVSNQVTIDGLHFTDATNVTFNGTPGVNFFVQSDTRIQVNAPPGVTSGPLRVNARNGWSQSSSNFYVPPVITGFSPGAGRAGTNVFISGTNLLGATAVLFGATPAAAYTVITNTLIQATVPAGISSAPLRVNAPAGSFITFTNFRIQPVITSFAPNLVIPGSGVTIYGSALNEGLSSVQFNGVPAAFSPPTYGTVNATVPVGAASGPISVTTTNGSFTTATLVYLPPEITGFTPTNGAAGTVVTLSGENFLGASAVRFNGLNASFTAPVNNTTLTATAPANVTTGPISVVAPAGMATSAGWFYAPPALTGFSPTHGLPGTVVTITGRNFLGATAVHFAGLPAASYTVVDNTSIQAVVPGGATNGVLRVTTPAGQVSSTGTFTLDYTADVQVLQSASPDPIPYGSNVVFLISIFNDGPFPSDNVRLTNTLPSQVDLLSATTTRGTLNTNGNPILGNIGTLASGEVISVRLTARTKSQGYITNLARIGTSTTDPIGTNNTWSLRALVQPPAVLAVRLTTTNTAVVSWSSSLSNYVLQAKSSLQTSVPWTNVLTSPVLVTGQLTVTEPLGAPPRYYRLRMQ